MLCRTRWIPVAAVLAFAASAAPAAPPQAETQGTNVTLSVDQPRMDSRFDRIATLIKERKPGEAIPILDALIAEEEQAHAGEGRRIRSAQSSAESLMYALEGATDNRETVVVGPNWSMAVFLKGFALIDLGRSDEAKPLLEKAVEMSPMNAQFLAELGEWHKNRREWTEAYGLFERAADAAGISSESLRREQKGRGLRGMGFVLIEQGRFDEAEKLFRKCLKLNPSDQSAKTELQYIREEKARRQGRSS
jgi:tetratricopeptide (TPR) repeat protein